MDKERGKKIDNEVIRLTDIVYDEANKQEDKTMTTVILAGVGMSLLVNAVMRTNPTKEAAAIHVENIARTLKSDLEQYINEMN